MIQFAKTKTIVSSMDPLIRIVISVMTEGKRNRIRSEMAPVLEELRELQSEISGIDLPRNEAGEVDDDKVDAKTLAELIRLNDRVQLITNTVINVKHLQASFVRLEGAEVEGMAIDSPEMLLEHAPEALTQEVLGLIKADAEMPSIERKNFE